MVVKWLSGSRNYTLFYIYFNTNNMAQTLLTIDPVFMAWSICLLNRLQKISWCILSYPQGYTIQTLPSIFKTCPNQSRHTPAHIRTPKTFDPETILFKRFSVSIVAKLTDRKTESHTLSSLWLCMTLYDCVWLSMNMYDYVRLCMTI